MASDRSDALRPQVHGGDTRQARERFGLEEVLDFSASINPLGTPPGLREHLFERWPQVLHYPDRGGRRCREAVAERFDLPPEAVVVGNGSAELIGLLLRSAAWARVLVSPPDFGLYRALLPAGVPVVPVPRVEARGFAPDLGALARAAGPGDLLLFSNPGNPSGAGVGPAELAGLLDRCAAVGAVLAVDEAFVDFCPELSVLDLAARRPGLVVLRSLTKFYGIPGLRLGFLAAAPARASAVAGLQVPWSVNTLAQEAAPYCLAHTEWEGRSRAYAARERERLAAGLGRLAGVRALPSRANYLLLHLSPPAPGAGTLYEDLARRGILVRHCGSFGLGERYLRVAVRTEEENALLLAALEDALAGAPRAGAAGG